MKSYTYNDLISKQIIFAFLFTGMGIAGPFVTAYYVTPFLTDWFEDGYTIGTELDLTFVKPFTTVYDLEDGWTFVEKDGERWLKKTVTYEHGKWPDYVQLNLVTTEKHHSGVEFRTFVNSNFGWMGPFPESFILLDYAMGLIGGAISGIQSIMLTMKKSKPDMKNVYFYQIHHVIINYSKNIIVIHKSINFS